MENHPSIWSRLRHKPSALLGLSFISLVALCAIMAYVIIDDTSPNANTQNPTIALKGLGFETEVIILKKNTHNPKSPIIGRLLNGSERPYKLYPIQAFEIQDDGIVVTSHFGQNKIIKSSDLYHDKPLGDQEHIKSKRFLLGTDKFGRSIFSRLILGIRVSLLVGLLAVVISLLVGIFLGAVGAYYGGWVDRIVMYLINVMWSIPTLLLVFAIVLAFGRGLNVIFLAVGLTMWVDVARIVRGQVLKIKEEQFVTAARSIGVKSNSILFKHILPNIIGPILVIGAANFATAILIEAGLSYLGFGVKPPTPSLGNMLNEHYGYAISGKPFLAIVPAVTIMLMVLSFNLLGSGLRDAYDVKD